MVFGATAAAAAAAGGTLFDYNRKNFLYDRKLRQEAEYQIMDFRIEQAKLWREDVKDIIGLTAVKMDTYLIVNAVQLGFCVMAFCEGRLAEGTPVWLIGCHTLSLAGAFMYLLMSVWFSMHASVTAKSYEVRLLTQLVRLPVPSWAQLEGARTYSSGFEKAEPKQMFRVPFAMGSQEAVLRSSAPAACGQEGLGPPSSAEAPAGPAGPRAEAADVWGLERRGDHIYELDGTLRSDPRKLRHLRLVREAMQYWQAYDGFARVAMSIGTNQLVTALAYYVIGYVLISNHAVIAAWLVVMLFMVVAAALIRLDMSLTGLEYRASVVLIISGPCLTAVAAEQWSRRTAVGYEVTHILTPIAYVVHAMWLMLLLHISNVREQKGGALLPTGFRSVMYIDVFGWIQRARSLRGRHPSDSPAVPAPPPADAATRAPGAGPAVQAVRYEQGLPLATRPEELPGAAQSPFALEGLRREDFEPTTFVPREKHSEKGPTGEAAALQARLRPSFAPWRLFCSATVLLVALWWILGVFVLLASCGVETLKVANVDHEGSQEHGPAALIQLAAPGRLTGGEAIATSWPQARIQPHSLACGDDGQTVVSSTRFGLFAARLGGGDGEAKAEFRAAPSCEGIEGESLQDVALSCSRTGACHALVLHRQGERLSTCAISDGQARSSGLGKSLWQLPVTMHLANEWLSDGNAADGLSQEEVTSISLADRCHGGGSNCAYVGTTRKRIVEVQMGLKSGGVGQPDSFPTRTLQADVGGHAVLPGGVLHLVDGAYLGVLQPDKRIEIIDPRNGTLIGQWQLPEAQAWSAMCSMGSSLYFLTKGRAPQLWRFPVPEPIRARSSGAPPPAPAAAMAEAAPLRAGAPAFLERQQQAVLAAG